jgi:hypothetical protein
MDGQTLAIEAAGWIGAVLVLAGYGLASAGRLDGRSPTFQWLNLVGAAGFVVNTAYHGAIPSMVLNIIWCGIAMFTLWKLRA